MKLEINPREFWSAVACHRFESGDMSPHSKWAFSLVELLVVITIIVVLLSLLAPALDKAIYQAELAVCGARQKAIAGGVTIYAGANRRSYPTRSTSSVTTSLKSGQYAIVGGPVQSATDDRPLLQTIFPMKMFNDPMVKAVDLSIEGTKGSDTVWGDYSLWWGVQWKDEKPMRKVGDRFTWRTSDSAHSFDLLATDLDFTDNAPEWRSSHPDKSGVMFPLMFQNERLINQTPYYTYSEWYSRSLRGAADYNYAHADGSVQSLADVTWKPGSLPDPRTVALPQYLNGANPLYVQQAPASW